MAESINLDTIVSQSVPVEYGGRSYTLREPTEEASIRAQAVLLRDAKMVDGKAQASMAHMAEARALLVSMSLFDEAGKCVPLPVVRGWPTSAVQHLHEALLRMMKTPGANGTNGDDAKAEEEAAKN